MNQQQLINAGLTNQGTGITLDDLTAIKYNYLGVCKNKWEEKANYKDKDGKIRQKKKYHSCEFKTEDRMVNICPKCRLYIVWEKYACDTKG